MISPTESGNEKERDKRQSFSSIGKIERRRKRETQTDIQPNGQMEGEKRRNTWNRLSFSLSLSLCLSIYVLVRKNSQVRTVVMCEAINIMHKKTLYMWVELGILKYIGRFI